MLQKALATIPAAELHELVQAMLDDNVPPFQLPGSGDSAETARTAQPILDRLDAYVAEAGETAEEQLWDELGTHVQFLYRGPSAPGLGHALLARATEPFFFALPDELFRRSDAGSRVYTSHPELMSRLDEKGLLELDRAWEVDPQTLFYREHAIAYHQFIRRDFTSNINDQLTGALIKIWHAHLPTTLRVAIDERRLQPASRFRHWGEKDFWYGPPLTEAALDDLNEIGVTRHWVVPGAEMSYFFPYSQMVVRWTSDRTTGLKTCEMEELVDGRLAKPRGGSQFVLLRYLHAIRDTVARTFVHVDGAVRGYRPDNYSIRAADPAGLGPHIEADAYRKVWRIDGSVSTDDWSELTVQWFRGNELVLEYLDPLAKPGTFGRAGVRAEREAHGFEFGSTHCPDRSS